MKKKGSILILGCWCNCCHFICWLPATVKKYKIIDPLAKN